jgi:putative ABC transport system permease protein
MLHLRYALRALRKSPGFAAAVILTLAIGIGANTAIFGLVNALLLRPLPFVDPDRLVYVSQSAPRLGERFLGVSPPDYLDWSRETRSFTGLAAYYATSFDLSRDNVPERVSGAVVTPNTFSILGVEPILGRAFLAEEATPGNQRVVLLSEDLWRRRFGADRAIIGRPVVVERAQYTVVGVMPAGIKFPEYAEIWTPLTLPADGVARDNRYLEAVGRLGPGASLEQARADLGSVARRIAVEHPESNAGTGVSAVELHSYYRGDVGSAIVVFLGVTFFVLLIVCVNIGSLLMARGVTRRREIAVRAALGAGRGSLLGQLLTESLILAGFGAVAGLILGDWARRLLLASIPVELPFWVRFDFDARTLCFILALTVGSVLLFGALPALHASRPDLQADLREGSNRATGDRMRHKLQNAFVGLQVALAVVLLVGAGLTAKSLLRLQRVDPGLDPRNVVAMRLFLPESSYPGAEQRIVFWSQLLERVRALPGVREAAVAEGLPLSGGMQTVGVAAEGAVNEGAGAGTIVDFNAVSPGYIETLRINVVRGRTLKDFDATSGAAVVNVALARTIFPNEDAVGRRIRVAAVDSAWLTVVGVVGNVAGSQAGQPPRPGVYTLHTRGAPAVGTLLVRSDRDPVALVPSVREALSELDPNLPLAQVETMEAVARRVIWQPRLYAWLLGIFGGVALLLAAVGVYGLVSYSVRRQTKEIGLRRALGARTGEVVGLVVRRGLIPTAAGVAVGLAGALMLVRLAAGLIHGVRPEDPSVIGSATLVLLAVAAVASLVPAWRAVRIEPMVALRDE